MFILCTGDWHGRREREARHRHHHHHHQWNPVPYIVTRIDTYVQWMRMTLKSWTSAFLALNKLAFVHDQNLGSQAFVSLPNHVNPSPLFKRQNSIALQHTPNIINKHVQTFTRKRVTFSSILPQLCSFPCQSRRLYPQHQSRWEFSWQPSQFVGADWNWEGFDHWCSWCFQSCLFRIACPGLY